MQWSVAKLGLPMFDALHAYGVATCLATSGASPLTLRDEGIWYSLRCETDALPLVTPPSFLDQVCPLPGPQELEHWANTHTFSLPVATFDGLLAALLTVPTKIRVASVEELWRKHLLFAGDPHAPNEPLTLARAKIAQILQQWKDWLTTQGGVHWLEQALQEYRPDAPHIPVLAPAGEKTITNVRMTLEPSFGYSYRQPINRGSLLNKCNLSLRGVHYAALLANIGASRFLRAQTLAGDHLVLSVPLPQWMQITADTILPPVAFHGHSPDHTLVLYALTLALNAPIPWLGLAFQVLQQQGKQQVIPSQSGLFSYAWLTRLPQRQRTHLLLRWKQWLANQTTREEETQRWEDLLAFLLHPQRSSWYEHLSTMVQRGKQHLSIHQHDSTYNEYSLEEVRLVMSTLPPTAPTHPLQTILQHKVGTMTFGRALRQLRRYNAADAREIMEDLEAVQDEETLFLVLTHLVQLCETAATARPEGRARYLLVPDEHDFAALLDDLHHYGVRTLISVLLILSVLRYPPVNEMDTFAVQTLIRALLALNQYGSQESATASIPAEEDTTLAIFSDDPTNVFRAEGEGNDGDYAPPWTTL